MQTKLEIEELVSRYQLKFPAEMKELEPIIHFLQRTPDEEIFNRSNFDGHITASSFVLNEKKDALLFIHHKKLDRWLQPGGHVDNSDQSLLQAAVRETVEETGMPQENLIPVTMPDTGAIFDIDSHFIPERPQKKEPSHTHHDCRFLFSCTTAVSFNVNKDETLGYKWMELTTLLDDAIFKKVAIKILGVLNEPPAVTIADKLV